MKVSVLVDRPTGLDNLNGTLSVPSSATLIDTIGGPVIINSVLVKSENSPPGGVVLVDLGPVGSTPRVLWDFKDSAIGLNWPCEGDVEIHSYPDGSGVQPDVSVSVTQVQTLTTS